ncbi:MAG: hypothetical protein JSR37_02195 [Verrucomicrobia bacterium]|nr:hypothetical protein [Verrucomicrobiota bacterium]MBS0637575.1 hypothetical protein [Verrucomicrobiota bacterium]
MNLRPYIFGAVAMLAGLFGMQQPGFAAKKDKHSSSSTHHHKKKKHSQKEKAFS